jgi:hypothetical protein
VTVSTTVITVLHSTEVVHFHYDSPKHHQGEQAGFTMKPFQGSSNKLGPLGFQLASKCRNPPFRMAQFHHGYTHRTRGYPTPIVASPFYAIKVTTKSLEKVLLYD